uniref:phosphatidylinositol phosphatase PTPRQ-like isoform X1 n=1 Tax=Styela clava TaxID=7725 RepID=UPI00193A5BE3|nr:phosphatidylinositol phosphatase PTPRQ-like isoform X1 [Styela clava]
MTCATIRTISPVLFIACMTSLSDGFGKPSCTNDLKCWTSCALGNCGYKPSVTAFVKCSWTFESPAMLHKYNYTLVLSRQDRKQCKPSVSKCDEKTGSCLSTFHMVDCSDDSTSHTDSISAWLRLNDGKVQYCENIFSFQICNYAKPDPIKITGISWSNSSKLNIEIEKPSCATYQLKYEFQYTWTNGIRNGTKTISVLEKKPEILGREATEYNITVRATTHSEKVFSSPVSVHHVTKPRKALDKKSLRFSCSKYHRDGNSMNVSISWKKMGIIDYFEMKMFDENKEKFITNKTIIPKRGNSHHNVHIQSLQPTKKYYIEITAHNSGGVSQAARFHFEKEKCKPPAQPRCSLSAQGKSWIEVQWDVDDVDDLYNYDVKLQHHDNVIDRIQNLEPSTRKLNLTRLKECILYKITVCSTIYSVEQSCCFVSSFTSGSVPKSPPLYQFKKITSRSITMQVTYEGIKDKLSCGRIQYYTIEYQKLEYLNHSKKHKVRKFNTRSRIISLTDLTPNTRYAIKVAMTNEAGIGMQKEIYVKTLQDAPDDSPEIRSVTRTSSEDINVSWKPPRKPNGEIEVYEVLIKTRLTFDEPQHNNDNCIAKDNDISCSYNGTNTSVLIKTGYAGIIHVRACTKNETGLMCSDWSDAKEIGVFEETGSLLLIILCVICGILMVFVIIVGTIYRCREQGPKPAKPWMHPVILSEFEKDLLSNKEKQEAGNVKKHSKG